MRHMLSNGQIVGVVNKAIEDGQIVAGSSIYGYEIDGTMGTSKVVFAYFTPNELDISTTTIAKESIKADLDSRGATGTGTLIKVIGEPGTDASYKNQLIEITGLYHENNATNIGTRYYDQTFAIVDGEIQITKSSEKSWTISSISSIKRMI